MAIIVITPAVMVINVIWQIREFHTKHYFFVANLLATNVAFIVAKNVKCLVSILYLLGLDAKPIATTAIYTIYSHWLSQKHHDNQKQLLHAW